MVLPKIGDRFSGAVQKTVQENKIIELQEEIQKLRTNSQTEQLELQIDSLREQLELSGKKQVKVDLIDPNPEQPRQTIPASAITVKAHSLSKHGQITPIILIPQENNRYILLDGQLRWEAAKALGWETISTVIVPMPKDLNHDSLLTFLHFEDLNPLDKAEAIVREVTKITKLESGEISTTLATVLKRIERDGKNKLLTQLVGVSSQEQTSALASMKVTEKEQSLLMVLLDLGLNPGSVKANLLPMLSLPTDLKIAIR
ncbi:ParB/RepB/Spo0J family partition protein [Synechocystis sp. PCC 7509]|uniref:ParB/RepB/Spo0J family partition protein n=1 Tax=Synechocystis sp. PCC 7509 TaxID=927677 RepID=UPI0002AC88A6|nr:ParB/RepB/Spo0J family partition protein [Synechocystis sp. PCC 7509]